MYEYKVEEIVNTGSISQFKIQKVLNEMSAQGWRLMSTESGTATALFESAKKPSKRQLFLFFERPVNN